MVLAAAASWGTWSLFLRPTGLPSTVTGPIIFFVMGAVTLPFALRRRDVVRWDRATLGLLVANAAFDACNILTFFAAISTTSIAIATLTHYAAPILIALAAPRIDKVRAPGTAPAALVALAGLVVILEPWRTPADGAVVGAAFGLASAVCYAGNTFVVRRLATRVGADRAMSYHSWIAAVALSPFAFVAFGAGEVRGADVALLTAGAATIGAASGVVFALGLMRIGSARTAVLTFAEPLVAVAVGFFVWDEALHPPAALGGALVLGAGIYVARKAG